MRVAVGAALALGVLALAALTARDVLLQAAGDFLVARDLLAAADAVIAISGDGQERAEEAVHVLEEGYGGWRGPPGPHPHRRDRNLYLWERPGSRAGDASPSVAVRHPGDVALPHAAVNRDLPVGVRPTGTHGARPSGAAQLLRA